MVTNAGVSAAADRNRSKLQQTIAFAFAAATLVLSLVVAFANGVIA
jgi:hypothetical protein